MVLNVLGAIAAVIIYLALTIYAISFCTKFGCTLSADPAVWGQFGDYMGGMLNPLLSFLSIVLLIKSLSLQNQTNLDLREQVKNNEKTERLRSFSVLFFNMIDSQKSLLSNLAIDFDTDHHSVPERGVRAILKIEDEIEDKRGSGADKTAIREFLSKLDSTDQMYGILRAFYITVKLISEKLNNDNGFKEEDRREYFLTLINFTDFAQLRLILLSIQFTGYVPADYLRNNEDFCSALIEVGLPLDPY